MQVHRHVDRRLQTKQDREPGHRKAPERIRIVEGPAQRAQDYECVQGQQNEAKHDAELLGGDRENEIGVRFGEDSLDRPLARPASEPAAPQERFRRGGWFGRGPGEGTIKRILPEAHTDFVFAVAAEEFGIVLCLVLLTLYAFIVLRALRRALDDPDPFRRFAVAGLAILFGLQSAINMAVHLHLIPAQGTTLPLISYGRPSII